MEDKIIFYSIGCPKCKVLKIKLDNAGINYEINDDVDEMKSLGIKSLPALKVNNTIMDFNQALKWTNETANGGCKSCELI